MSTELQWTAQAAEPAGQSAVPATPSVPAAATNPETQQSAIDAALAGLDNLDAMPVSEHVVRFDAVHAALSDALSAVDRI